jgi:PTS system glucose-specific IIA component
MIEEKEYNTITMMIVVNDERISKLEKGDQLDKPLIKVQYK